MQFNIHEGEIMRFDEILEAVEQLPPEDQEALITLLQRRALAQRRAALARDVKEARQEMQTGACQPRTPDELLGEIMS